MRVEFYPYIPSWYLVSMQSVLVRRWHGYIRHSICMWKRPWSVNLWCQSVCDGYTRRNRYEATGLHHTSFPLKKSGPDWFFKISVAILYSFGEVKLGCRRGGKITTYVPSPGNLAVLEIPAGILPATSAPYWMHLCQPNQISPWQE